MKRKISLSVCLIMIISLLAACSSKEQAPLNIDFSEFSADVLESGAFAEELEQVEPDIGCYLYGIDGEGLEDMLFYMSAGATADELTLFKASSEEAAAELETSISERLEYQKNSFASYNPAEVSKLDGAVLKTSGVYVLLVVADDYDAADSVIDEYFKA